MSSTEMPVLGVYVLTGDDVVGKEHCRQRIIQKVNDSYGQAVSQKYDSSVEGFDEFLQKILTPSLFNETRVFQISHAQNLSDSEIKELAVLLDAPPPDSCIIIDVDEEKSSKTGKSTSAGITKKLDLTKRAKNGKCIHQSFPKPPDYQIAAWLMERVPQLFERKISKQDAEYLVELVGNDIGLLYSELQKIDINLEPGKPIIHSCIEEIVGASRQMSVFELAAALAEKDLARALVIVNSLFETDFYGPMMISAVFKKFWALFRIRHFGASNPDVVKKFLSSQGFKNTTQTETGYAIGLAAGLLSTGQQAKIYPVMILSRVVQQSMNFSEKELAEIFRWLLQFDIGIKTGKIAGTQQDVQLLCYKIVRVSKLFQDENS